MSRPHWLIEALAVGNDSGLGRHVRLFLDALAGLSAEFQFTVLIPMGVAYQPPAGLHAIHVRPWPMRAWVECALPIWVARLNPTGVLHLGYTVPRWPLGRPSLLLVPDVGPLESGELRMSRHVHLNRKALRRQIPKAARILVSTSFIAQRLSAFMSISPQTIGVIPPFGAYTSEWSQPTSEDQNLARLYPHGYMLSVGNIEPRKNHLGLIRAYAWAQARHSPSQEVSPSGLSRAFPHLVLVGNEAWDGGVTRKEVERLGLKAQITFTGHISDASLGAHLRQSLLFVTASLYEGFGMPLFEALCLGKACIYHAGTAHDSFANGAALAVDCQKPEVLGAAMTRLSLDATWRGEIEIKAKQRSQDLLSHDLPAALRNVLLAAKEV